MKALFLCALLLLPACTNAPKIVLGKGAVYGIVSADIHPDLKKKMLEADVGDASVYAADVGEGIVYQADMLNYANLTELYVGLISLDNKPQQHYLSVGVASITPSSLALSLEDTLHIVNNTAIAQHFYITGNIDEQGFQSFPELKTGQSGVYKVELEGHLQLLSEEDDSLKAYLFVKKNMLSQRVSSGETYQFEQLIPGNYQLIFWYWRLGLVKQDILIKAQENLRIDKTLTVDGVMQSH